MHAGPNVLRTRQRRCGTVWDMSAWKWAQTLAAFLAAQLVAELLIYGQWMVPALPRVSRVPLWWWAGMYAPVLVACVWGGVRVQRVRDAVALAVLMGLVTQVLKWALAHAGAPGHHKSAALEDPVAFWTTFHARVTGGFLVLVLASQAVARVWRSRR